VGCTDTCRDAVPLAARYHDTKGSLLLLEQSSPCICGSLNRDLVFRRNSYKETLLVSPIFGSSLQISSVNDVLVRTENKSTVVYFRIFQCSLGGTEGGLQARQ
jgi:hypothetical protein